MFILTVGNFNQRNSTAGTKVTIETTTYTSLESIGCLCLLARKSEIGEVNRTVAEKYGAWSW
jgi:hypothetical protein